MSESHSKTGKTIELNLSWQQMQSTVTNILPVMLFFRTILDFHAPTIRKTFITLDTGLTKA